MIPNEARPLVCVVDDDSLVRESVEGLLRTGGFHVDTFESAESFLGRPGRELPACLIVDLVLPGMSGLDLHEELARRGIDAPMILVTGHGDIRTSVRAMKAGALDFLTKPYDVDELLAAVRRTIQEGLQDGVGRRIELMGERESLRAVSDRTASFEEFVGDSVALTSVLSRVSKVAGSDATVLITGETGTGKELVARAIHKRSRRAARAFVAVNCGAIPRDLLASELFGHEKGAFTGAIQRRLGRFELANGGTIFLDEVGDLASDTQVALLRVLQEHEFERVGGRERIHTDARVVAATNRDLAAAVTDGTFREDLFYRLNVFPIEMPPLRGRREDIRALTEYFVGRFAQRAGKTIRGVSERTLDRLQSYSWPGNVRELQNVIERSVIVSDTDELTVDESWLPAPSVESGFGLSGTLVAQERLIIEEALRASGGRVFGPLGAAERLGIPRSTLESKIRALRINKSRFRTRATMTE